MKKTFTLMILCCFIFSCGPKRMSCYGKRCVETSVKKDMGKTHQVNS